MPLWDLACEVHWNARVLHRCHLWVGATPKHMLMWVRLAYRERLLSHSQSCRRIYKEFVTLLPGARVWRTIFHFSFAGVSCDACLKGNFRGRRFKCLICYDYDLCASCYESGATTTRHTTEHPMQCILTRVDYGKDLKAQTESCVAYWSYTNLSCLCGAMIIIFYDFTVGLLCDYKSFVTFSLMIYGILLSVKLCWCWCLCLCK